MKFKELLTKTTAELHKLLSEKREDIRNMNFKLANRSLKNVRDIRNVKRTIAHILTILNKK